MLLFLSDIHFGRTDTAAERAKEADLVACLRAHAEEVTHLYLVGDVYDQFIEYRHLVPRGFVRFQALLAEWTDRGVPVTYLAGNHDPWHRDYFAQELGVQYVADALQGIHFGRTFHIVHGDGVDPAEWLYRRLKPLLRHPVPVWLYQNLLPGDLGMALASRVRHGLGREQINHTAVCELRDEALRLLRETEADVVVMGHVHLAQCVRWPEGDYLNPGYWHQDRTFATYDADGPHLLHWNGHCTTPYTPAS